jgi:hypothetical protein
LGLASSEKQIPQVDENTEKAKWLLDALESVGRRPRQASYQAALRPDMKCFIDSTALPNITATPNLRFWLKTLKREEIYAGCYCDFDDLNQRLEDFIDRYYNRCRLHSALKYRSPETFESACEEDRDNHWAAAVVTFCSAG